MSYTTIIDNYYTPYLDKYYSYSYSASRLDRIKDFTFKTKDKLVDFFNKPETKIAALVSYWAIETVFTVAAIYAFLTLHLYLPAITALFLIAYLSYATFGVVGEAIK